jgi:hypothetical protein
MNAISSTNGLSARRKAISCLKKNIVGFRSTMMLFIIASLMLVSCHEKSNGQQTASAKKGNATVAQDSLDKPKVNIKVNRHYDDKGNMIGFDSTYSSYYSNIKGDTSRMDSLINSFDQYFSRNHASLFNNNFNSLFFNDSLRYPDFFHNDFFMKRYELNDAYMRNMMRHMDSVKNRFYSEQSMNDKNNKDTQQKSSKK